MKYCPNCASKQKDDYKYCDKCGEKFSNDESSSTIDTYYIICIIVLCLSLIRSFLSAPYFGITFFIGFALTIKYRIKPDIDKKLPIILLCLNIVIVFVRVFIEIVKI